MRWGREFGATSPVHPLLTFLAVTLLVRVLTDDLSSPYSRHSGSLNLSAGIAALFIFAAGGLLLRHRRGVLPSALAVLWLCIWTAVAVSTRGASAETIREGVREASVIALAFVVLNSRGTITVSIATRMVQLLAFIPAVLAIFQLASHTGMDISGELRSNGTFAHPNSAAMFFAIATTVSLWLYLDGARRRFDALFTALFAAALIATVSIDGLITLIAMLVALGTLRPGSLRVKLGPNLVAAAVVLAFFASPLGPKRIAQESTTAEGGGANTSLSWRLHKWKMLLPEWERNPVFGQGLGTTITVDGVSGNAYIGEPPHNEYLRYLVESGVVGLAILLCGLALMLRGILRKRLALDTPLAAPRNTYTLVIVVIFGCLVNALAENTLLNTPTCYVAALIVAAALSLPAVERQRASAPQTV